MVQSIAPISCYSCVIDPLYNLGASAYGVINDSCPMIGALAQKITNFVSTIFTYIGNITHLCWHGTLRFTALERLTEQERVTIQRMVDDLDRLQPENNFRELMRNAAMGPRALGCLYMYALLSRILDNRHISPEAITHGFSTIAPDLNEILTSFCPLPDVGKYYVILQFYNENLSGAPVEGRFIAGPVYDVANQANLCVRRLANNPELHRMARALRLEYIRTNNV